MNYGHDTTDRIQELEARVSLLEGLLAADAPKQPTAPGKGSIILKLVSDEFGYTLDEMRSHRRGKRLIEARHAACLLIHENTILTLSQIGRLLNRDHTSVMHGISHAAAIRDRDEAYRARLDAIAAKIGANNG